MKERKRWRESEFMTLFELLEPLYLTFQLYKSVHLGGGGAVKPLWL